MERKADGMEDGKKKVWICIIVAALAAVVIGLLYYLSAPRAQSEEGFLIKGGKENRCVSVSEEYSENLQEDGNGSGK